MSRTSIAPAEAATASVGKKVASYDRNLPSNIIDSGRSLGSDNTESTVSTTSSESSSVNTGGIRSGAGSYDALVPIDVPIGGSSGDGGSSSRSQRPRSNSNEELHKAAALDAWALKIARNPSSAVVTISSTSSNSTSSTSRSASSSSRFGAAKSQQQPKLRRSRSNEDIQLLEQYVRNAMNMEMENRNGNGNGDATWASSSPAANDLTAMMDGVAERRKARQRDRRETKMQQPSEDDVVDGETSTPRRMQRRNSAPASNRSLEIFDDFDDDESSDGTPVYRKTIRWTDHHGIDLEEIRVLDPQMSEGGRRRAEKLRARRGYSSDGDDETESDEEESDDQAQYDSDETPSSGSGSDEDEAECFVEESAEESMVFDFEGKSFGGGENIDLADMADASLSLVDAMSGTLEEEEQKTQRTTKPKNSANRRLKKYGRQRDEVQEGSMSLDDLDGLGVTAAVMANDCDTPKGSDDKPAYFAEASTNFGEVSMDLSEISAELNDELRQLPGPTRNSKNNNNKRGGMHTVMEDSMNVFPDPELVSSKDKAINGAINANGDLPVPTSVVVANDDEQAMMPLEASFTKTKSNKKNINKINEKWMDSMAAVKDGEPLMTDDDLFGNHNKKRNVGPLGDISVIEVDKNAKDEATTASLKLSTSRTADTFFNFEGRVNYGRVPSTKNVKAPPPTRRNRSGSSNSSFSPSSSPTPVKPKVAINTKQPHGGFDNFAKWGNESFEVNTAPTYLAKTTKKQHKGTKQGPPPSARPSRPSGKPRPPSRGGHSRPAKGPGPTRHQQQHHQQARRSSKDRQTRVPAQTDRPHRSSSTGSDAPRVVVPANSMEKVDTAARKSTKAKSRFGGLFSRGQSEKPKKGEDEVAFMSLADQSLGDSLNSFGDLAGLDSYFDPQPSGNKKKADGLAASITRSTQKQQQQRRRDSLKGRSLDDSDALLFAHIKDGEQQRRGGSFNDSPEDLFDAEMLREMRGDNGKRR